MLFSFVLRLNKKTRIPNRLELAKKKSIIRLFQIMSSFFISKTNYSLSFHCYCLILH